MGWGSRLSNELGLNSRDQNTSVAYKCGNLRMEWVWNRENSDLGCFIGSPEFHPERDFGPWALLVRRIPETHGWHWGLFSCLDLEHAPCTPNFSQFLVTSFSLPFTSLSLCHIQRGHLLFKIVGGLVSCLMDSQVPWETGISSASPENWNRTVSPILILTVKSLLTSYRHHKAVPIIGEWFYMGYVLVQGQICLLGTVLSLVFVHLFKLNILRPLTAFLCLSSLQSLSDCYPDMSP